MSVALHQGPELDAAVLEYDVVHDVALVQLTGSGYPCAALAAAVPGAGQPVYLVGASVGGAPRSGVAGGVVSGVRLEDDVELIQTDVAPTPGGIGGPMLDRTGALVGIVTADPTGAASSASLAVPVDAVQRWLGLRFGERSDAFSAPAPAPVLELLVDPPDPPIIPRDAMVCLFRRGNGPETAFRVEDRRLVLGARQFGCVDVPSGGVTVARAGAIDTSFRVRGGDALYLLVVGRSLSRAERAEFERAKTKGLEEVLAQELP